MIDRIPSPTYSAHVQGRMIFNAEAHYNAPVAHVRAYAQVVCTGLKVIRPDIDWQGVTELQVWRTALLLRQPARLQTILERMTADRARGIEPHHRQTRPALLAYLCLTDEDFCHGSSTEFDDYKEPSVFKLSDALLPCPTYGGLTDAEKAWVHTVKAYANASMRDGRAVMAREYDCPHPFHK